MLPDRPTDVSPVPVGFPRALCFIYCGWIDTTGKDRVMGTCEAGRGAPVLGDTLCAKVCLSTGRGLMPFKRQMSYRAFLHCVLCGTAPCNSACTFFDHAILNTMKQVVMTVLWLPGGLLPSAIQSLQIEVIVQHDCAVSAKLNFFVCFSHGGTFNASRQGHFLYKGTTLQAQCAGVKKKQCGTYNGIFILVLYWTSACVRYPKELRWPCDQHCLSTGMAKLVQPIFENQSSAQN